MPRAFVSARASDAPLRRAPPSYAETMPIGAKRHVQRHAVLQAFASVVISIIFTALTMYIFVGADMRASVSVAQIWRVGMAISVVAPALIAPLMSYRIGLLVRSLEGARDQLEVMARRDPLTGLLNRRGVETAAQEIWSRRSGAVCVVMLDIDRFKSINDAHGHDIGDLALIHVARVIREAISAPGRVVARLGGEEFAVLLPGADLAEGLALAETLRAACEANPLRLEASSVPITLSLGVAAQAPEQASLRRLIGQADKALYRAKQEGRNRVCAAESAAWRETDVADRPALGARALAAG
jgi:diguanylate cyclase (GGDEF)-like protein